MTSGEGAQWKLPGAVARGIQDRSLDFLRDPALWSGILPGRRPRLEKPTLFLKDPGWMAQSAVVRDYRVLETGRRPARTVFS